MPDQLYLTHYGAQAKKSTVRRGSPVGSEGLVNGDPLDNGKSEMMTLRGLNHKVFRSDIVQCYQVDRAKFAVFPVRGDRKLSIREKNGAFVCVVFVVKESCSDLA